MVTLLLDCNFRLKAGFVPAFLSMKKRALIMNYQEQLNELKKSDMRDDVEVKFVPGKHEDV